MQKAKRRRVTVVFNDNQINKLVLVEAYAMTRMVPDENHFIYRVDRHEAEHSARTRLAEQNKEVFPNTVLEMAMSRYDWVGVLIAHEDALAPGRISWCDEIDVTSPVTV
jgi:hypothetical protein